MLGRRTLSAGELNRELFRFFIRHQVVTKCWRRDQGEWLIRDAPFVDDWSEEDYDFFIACLGNTINAGGLVLGAFFEGKLKGVASVEPELFGGEHWYLDLSSIHVSEDMRGRGMGAALFAAAKDWARAHGGKSCTYPLTLRWRAKLSAVGWAVWRRASTIKSMWRRSPLIASWSVCFEQLGGGGRRYPLPFLIFQKFFSFIKNP